jgi:hypothetical protein
MFDSVGLKQHTKTFDDFDEIVGQSAVMRTLERLRAPRGSRGQRRGG